MKIDFIEGTAAIVGPARHEERAALDWFIERREMLEGGLQHMRDQRAEATDARLIGQIDEEIG